jgi:phosphoserine phosphatase
MIIFDICGTLYNSNTTMDFCEYRCKSARKRKLLKFSKTFFGKLVNKLLVMLFNYDFIRVLHLKSLKGLTKNEIEKDAAFFVNFFLINKKIDEVHVILNNYEKEDIVLVSATIQPIAEAIAHKLGGVKYLSTTLEYNYDKCTGTIKDDLLGNKQNYFRDQEIELVITDNKSDLSLCKKAKEVVIVSKKKNLSFWEKRKLKISKFIKV